MRKLGPMMVAIAVVALTASVASAQPRPGQGGGMPTFGLLTQKPVQTDLKLSDEQLKKIETYNKAQQDELGKLEGAERFKKMAELREKNDKFVKDTLKEDQAKRLKQIGLQVLGGRALSNPEIAKDLSITDEQKKKFQSIQQASREEMKKAFEDMDRKKLTEIGKATSEKLMAVLTDDQKKKWKEMTGAPVKDLDKIQLFGGGRPMRQP